MTAGISGYTSSFKFKRIEFDWPRWHDPMNSNWDRLDSILNTYIASNGITGDWANSTIYAVGDKLFDTDTYKLFICSVAHTSASTGTFSEDRLANPLYWTAYNFVPIQKGEWQTLTTYTPGAFVYSGAIFAYCIAQHVSGTLATDISAGYWAVLIDADAVVEDINNAKTDAQIAATNASASAASASDYATTAAASMASTSTSATNAANSETNAAASELASASSATDALAAQTAAESARDSAALYAAQTASKASIRNRHLNPAFQVCQDRATGATVAISSSAYVHDGVWVAAAGGGTLTCSQAAKVTPGGSPYRTRLAVSAADTALAATDCYAIELSIEGTDVADLMFGTASARSFVWRGVINAPAGTYHVSFRNGACTRSYVVPVTVSVGEANTDKLVTITVPGDITGTWISDASGKGINVGITIATGSAYQTTTANAWQSGNYVATAAQTNGMASTSNVFEVADIGFYAGSELPTWEMPSVVDDLRKCHRYYWACPVGLRMYAPSTNATYREVSVKYPAEMRTTPALSGAASAGTLNIGWINSSTLCVSEVTDVSATTDVMLFPLIANARL